MNSKQIDEATKNLYIYRVFNFTSLRQIFVCTFLRSTERDSIHMTDNLLMRLFKVFEYRFIVSAQYTREETL